MTGTGCSTMTSSSMQSTGCTLPGDNMSAAHAAKDPDKWKEGPWEGDGFDLDPLSFPGEPGTIV
eukprot:1740832-Rhodomonas_salina.3